MENQIIEELYREMGISGPVFRFGQQTLRVLEERFREIDAVAEYNQLKVLRAMQKNRVSAEHFNWSM